MRDFEKYWKSGFPGISPVSSSLRKELPARWVRFHSLPGSKRYADNEREYTTITHRANVLAGEVLGQNSKCWLVASLPLEDLNKREKQHWNEMKESLDLTNPFQWYISSEAPEDRSSWTVFSKSVVWKKNAFNPDIRTIADDLFPRLFWVSASATSIFAPYDGGFDLIVANKSHVQPLKEKFSDWLSPHQAGL